MAETTALDAAKFVLQVAIPAIPLWLGAMKFYFEYTSSADTGLSGFEQNEIGIWKLILVILRTGITYGFALFGLVVLNEIVVNATDILLSGKEKRLQTIFKSLRWFASGALVLIYLGLGQKLYSESHAAELEISKQRAVFFGSAGLGVVIVYSILAIYITGQLTGLTCYIWISGWLLIILAIINIAMSSY